MPPTPSSRPDFESSSSASTDHGDGDAAALKIDWVVDVWVKREGDWRLGSATAYHPPTDPKTDTGALTVDIESDGGRMSGKVRIGAFSRLRLVESRYA